MAIYISKKIKHEGKWSQLDTIKSIVTDEAIKGHAVNINKEYLKENIRVKNDVNPIISLTEKHLILTFVCEEHNNVEKPLSPSYSSTKLKF